MTAQEIFEIVAKHLISQGKQALGPLEGVTEDVCLYRAPDGSKCAFGALIPDEKYTPQLENVQAQSLIEQEFPEYLPHSRLIVRLQDTHDDDLVWSDGPASLVSALRVVADEFGLSPAVLEQEPAQ